MSHYALSKLLLDTEAAKSFFPHCLIVLKSPMNKLCLEQNLNILKVTHKEAEKTNAESKNWKKPELSKAEFKKIITD
jgi:hypothetical protein